MVLAACNAPSGTATPPSIAAREYPSVPFLAFTHQHIDLSNMTLKEIAVRQGIYGSSALRAPQMVIDRYHQRVADELINDMVALDHEMRAIPLGRAKTEHALA